MRHPLNPDHFPEHMREHVRWHLLFQRADDLAARTGLGLANVWGAIKRGDYDEAVEMLDAEDQYQLERRALSPRDPDRAQRHVEEVRALVASGAWEQPRLPMSRDAELRRAVLGHRPNRTP